MKQIYTRLSAGLLVAILCFGFSAKSQLVQTGTITFPGPPATSCTNTNIDAAVLLLCINIAYNGSTVSVAGSNITVDLDYSLGPICLGALSNVVENVNLGMVPAGTYTVTVNGNLNGAFASSSTASLTVASCCSAIPAFTASADTICPGDSVYFNNTSTGTMSQDWYVNNSVASNAVNYGRVFNSLGAFDVKLVVNGMACSDSITQTLYVINSSTCCPVQPSFSASNDSICPGDSVFFNNTTAGATSQSWYLDNSPVSNALNFGQSFTAPGTYTVSLVASDGTCSDSIFTRIRVFDASINLGPDVSICDGGSVFLFAGSTYDSLVWSNGSRGSSITVGAGTHYITTYRQSCEGTDTMVVSLFATPGPSLGADTVLCVDSTLILDATQMGASYLWNDGSTGSTLSVQDSGTYWVQVTDTNTCISSDTIFVDLDSCNISLNELSGADFSIYPNPATTEIVIRLTHDYNHFKVLRISDLSGRELVRHDLLGWDGSEELDVRNIPAGLYLIELLGDTDSQSQLLNIRH